MVSLPRLVTTARILPFVMLASDSLSAGREIVGVVSWDDELGSGLDRAQSSEGMAASFVALMRKALLLQGSIQRRWSSKRKMSLSSSAYSIVGSFF